MEDKVCDFVYTRTDNYLSLTKIASLFAVAFLMQGIVFFAALSAESIALIICTILYDVFFATFIAMIKTKCIKNTFELRFLSNGIVGLALSVLFILFLSAFAVNAYAIDIAYVLWVLLFYVLFLIFYTALIVAGIHKGVYGKLRQKSRSATVLMVEGLLASLVPLSSALGILYSKIVRWTASESFQALGGIACCTALVFMTGLAHINFIKYYYCKKYGIACDENGDTTSPLLEHVPTDKSEKPKITRPNKKMNIFLKIVLVILGVPVVIFVVVFVVGYVSLLVKDIIEFIGKYI